MNRKTSQMPDFVFELCIFGTVYYCRYRQNFRNNVQNVYGPTLKENRYKGSFIQCTWYENTTSQVGYFKDGVTQ